MLAVELHGEISALLESINRSPELWEYLQKLDGMSDHLQSMIAKFTKDVGPAGSELHNVLNASTSDILCRPLAIADAARDLVAAFTLAGQRPWFESLAPTAEQGSGFVLAFEDFFYKQNAANAFRVVVSGAKWMRMIEQTKVVLGTIASVIEPPTAAQDEQELKLVFHGDMSPRETVARLNSLIALYELLCELLGRQNKDSLRLGKIETGSLAVQVFGDPSVITVLLGFIPVAVGFFYRKHIGLTKAAAISARAKAVLDVVEVKRQLEALGVNTDGMDRSLEAASVELSRNLDSLLAPASTITVNGKVIVHRNAEVPGTLLIDRAVDDSPLGLPPPQ